MAKRKKHLRKRSKRKAATKKQSNVTGRPSMSLLRSSSSWPLLEVIINAEWEDTTQITQLIIARRGPTGQVAIGTFLIDLACLGIKNAYGYFFPNERVYRNSFRADMTSKQKMVEIELDCAAKIIEEAIAYAKKLGFRPHKDIRYALPVMGETHPERCDLDVPLGGPEGKPFFIAGPYDNPERIMRILDRKVGPGNYTYLMPIGPESFFFEDDDFDEEWEE